MSYEDDVIWRVHLDLYNCPAEPLPITKVTTHFIWTEEWSGKMIHHDGTHTNIGKRTAIRLDRNELACNGAVRRGRILYAFTNPDDRLAPADEHDPDETPLPRSPEFKARELEILKELEAKRDALCKHVRITVGE